MCTGNLLNVVKSILLDYNVALEMESLQSCRNPHPVKARNKVP